MAFVLVACVQCQQTNTVVKNGKANTGHQRYKCHHCKKSYRYNGRAGKQPANAD